MVRSGVLPYVGAVIRYAYLWRDDARRGGTTGRKDRPCVILAAATVAEGVRVYAAPITRTEQPEERAIRLTRRTRMHLGLEPDTPSWLVIDEINHFLWRGADVVPLDADRDHYGALPDALVAEAQRRFNTIARAEQGRGVSRDEPTATGRTGARDGDDA